MPKSIVLSVRDRAANAYGRPFYVPSVGTGIRSFSDWINSPTEKGDMQTHPEDFDLYHLAEFDDETGVFECLTQPKQLAVGKDLKIKS